MAAQTKTYRTIQGDAWDAIAYRLWEEERFMADLMAANPEHADVLVFPAGVILALPTVDVSAKTASSLPPWVTS
ncbi:MAG: tail protein X [Desulfovibrio sp.]|jgi:phage tail protein X|nr:tail protein X [Desulfovibrio sp.]